MFDKVYSNQETLKQFRGVLLCQFQCVKDLALLALSCLGDTGTYVQHGEGRVWVWLVGLCVLLLFCILFWGLSGGHGIYFIFKVFLSYPLNLFLFIYLFLQAYYKICHTPESLMPRNHDCKLLSRNVTSLNSVLSTDEAPPSLFEAKMLSTSNKNSSQIHQVYKIIKFEFSLYSTRTFQLAANNQKKRQSLIRKVTGKQTRSSEC